MVVCTNKCLSHVFEILHESGGIGGDCEAAGRLRRYGPILTQSMIVST